ncbi:hypothetical protein VA7868_01411 [Vibrio aerogenes CECT 7868]|uniref:Uncharacterized protein n=1 Tax=Vibrio aerogenes CECT 7868 TaxID=1216006 RepID=A0A1M5Y0N0_9VIBR|nr:hypothetical protein [Vibrio aerogenes]SHI05499.1 hypothetical protein VA7868_01411 [Vibrio aerogenes CECT 7868]
MKKSRTNIKKKTPKTNANYEAKFEQMVGEYHAAKALLDSMTAGTPEHSQQKKHCDSLFASAERFFNRNNSQ